MATLIVAARPPPLCHSRASGNRQARNAMMQAGAPEQIALGLTRPIGAARGDAVSDRVHKVRFDRIAICSRRALRARPQ